MKYPFFIGVLLLAFSCSFPANGQDKINATQTEQMLQSDSTVQLLDVRTAAELQATGVIKGAVHCNFNAADFATQLNQLDKSKPVIVYCAAGGRSPKAAAMMQKMGFTKVYDYAGGMNDWRAKGKPTTPKE